MNKIVVFILMVTMASSVLGQDTLTPSILADRPGMATPPSLMQAKILQLESGFSYEYFSFQDISFEYTLYNTSLLRYGITKNAEIRLQTDYADVRVENTKIINGFNPITVGTKLLISESKGIVPATSFLLNLTLPWFGDKDFRPENLTPSMYLLMQNDINDKFNVCYNLGLEYDGAGPTPYEFAAICFGYNLTDKLSVFIENYNWFSNIAHPQNYVDLGCAYLTGKNFQIDISGNMNLQDSENYFMINFGVAWRIMK